jgi:hypothetical protein
VAEKSFLLSSVWLAKTNSVVADRYLANSRTVLCQRNSEEQAFMSSWTEVQQANLAVEHYYNKRDANV